MNDAHGSHLPVMPEEVLSAWLTDPDGVYVDGTFGRGGHSKQLLEKLTKDGRLYAFDRDLSAIDVATGLAGQHEQLRPIHQPFSMIANFIEREGLLGEVNGVLLDLGVSSPQLDDASRGFSFMRDGPLDMRMNNAEGQTAEEWLATAEGSEIASVLRKLGEEPFAGRIARAIVDEREKNALTTTLQLAALIERVIPARVKHKSKTHVATRSFQAIRLHINDELGEVRRLLADIVRLLRPGGRLAVISFHSLEDRIVKRFIRDAARGNESLSGIPLRESEMGRLMKLLGGAQRATPEEVGLNPRSRSAILRVAEKL